MYMQKNVAAIIIIVRIFRFPCHIATHDTNTHTHAQANTRHSFLFIFIIVFLSLCSFRFIFFFVLSLILLFYAINIFYCMRLYKENKINREGMRNFSWMWWNKREKSNTASGWRVWEKRKLEKKQCPILRSCSFLSMCTHIRTKATMEMKRNERRV